MVSKYTPGTRGQVILDVWQVIVVPDVWPGGGGHCQRKALNQREIKIQKGSISPDRGSIDRFFICGTSFSTGSMRCKG